MENAEVYFRRSIFLDEVNCFSCLALAPEYCIEFAMRRIIQFNEEGIQGRLSLRKTIALPWSSIASIEARMFTLLIRTKDGQEVPIDLGEISYRQHKIVKPKFIDAARSKGIPVTTGQTLLEP